MEVPDVDSAACFINALPDHLLEKILSSVPIPSIISAKRVCRRWRDLASSKSFTCNEAPQPWYFMFTRNEANSGHLHDPVHRSWYGGQKLPCVEASYWLTSSSNGLVCFMDHVSQTSSRVFVCNPITKAWKRIDDPPRGKFSFYSALSIYSSSSSPGYKISVVESTEDEDDFLRCEFCIHVYDSITRSWDTPMKDTMMEWRGGTESVICRGVLYCLIDCPRMATGVGTGHRIIVYDLAKGSTSSLLSSSIPAPCSLTCGRLMNLRERMIMVGGIEKRGRRDFIEGVGVWELVEREWREISRMPHRFFKGFRELDDVFVSSGAGDLIYVQSYGAPTLLVFDMKKREWRWSVKCPLPRRSSLDLYTGFSFLPRLEISP